MWNDIIYNFWINPFCGGLQKNEKSSESELK